MYGEERRQHPRLTMAVEIDFRSDSNFYAARTRDISAGGLFIETDIALPIGTRLSLDLTFMKKHLKADAEVAWVLVGNSNGESVGVGMRFVALSEAAKRSIEAFMVFREPMAFGTLESDEEDDEHEQPSAEAPSAAGGGRADSA